jgi:hypothetical protein
MVPLTGVGGIQLPILSELSLDVIPLLTLAKGVFINLDFASGVTAALGFNFTLPSLGAR